MKRFAMKSMIRTILPITVFFTMIIIGCDKDEPAGPTGPDPGGNPPTSTGTYTQTGTLQGPAEAVAGIAISPDGKTMAFGTFADNSLRVVNVETRQIAQTLTGHTNRVTELTFSPDSRLLASTGTVNLSPGDGSVRVWDVATGSQRATVATTGTSQLAFSPNGVSLAGASGGDPLRVQVWDANTLSLQRTISGVFRIVAFSPDGSRIATGARNDNIHIMNFATGAEITALTGHTGWITAVAYSPNGQLLASAGDDRAIKVWNAQTGQSTRTLTGHTTYADFILLNADGTLLASAGSGTNITRTSSGTSISISNADRFLRLWNLSTGEELTRINIGTDVLSGAAFSADWSVIVTGSNTGLIRFFRRG